MPEETKVPPVPATFVVPKQEDRKYKKVRLEVAHLFEGVRYLEGEHVVPVEFNVRQGEVLSESVDAKEYKVPDQRIETIKNIGETIAPTEKAPIGGDTSGKVQQVAEESDDTPVAGGKSKPSAQASSGSVTKEK